MSKFVAVVKPRMRASIVAALVAMAMPSLAADDLAVAKEYTVRYCSQCHTFEQGEKHGQGPNLFGLIGREAAAAPGFVYSEGIKEALKGKVWDHDRSTLGMAGIRPMAQGRLQITPHLRFTRPIGAPGADRLFQSQERQMSQEMLTILL